MEEQIKLCLSLDNFNEVFIALSAFVHPGYRKFSCRKLTITPLSGNRPMASKELFKSWVIVRNAFAEVRRITRPTDRLSPSATECQPVSVSNVSPRAVGDDATVLSSPSGLMVAFLCKFGRLATLWSVRLLDHSRDALSRN